LEQSQLRISNAIAQEVACSGIDYSVHIDPGNQLADPFHPENHTERHIMEVRMSIFTKTEAAELELRLTNQKKNYKIWYRVKPKLRELLELFKIKDKITWLLEPTPQKHKVLEGGKEEVRHHELSHDFPVNQDKLTEAK